MGLSFYYIQRSWNALSWVTHLNISQTKAIWSTAILGNGTFILLYFKVPKTLHPEKKPLKVSQKATICSLELENTGNIWKKFKKFEKLTKVLELPLQYCKMGLSFHCISECQYTTVLLTQLSIIRNH